MAEPSTSTLRESVRMARALHVLPWILLIVSGVSWYAVVTWSPTVAWLEDAGPIAGDGWFAFVATLGVLAWMLLKSNTIHVRLVWVLFAASLITGRAISMRLAGPVAWPLFLDAIRNTLACIVAFRALWLQRASAAVENPL
jgi:hypothetical protein